MLKRILLETIEIKTNNEYINNDDDKLCDDIFYFLIKEHYPGILKTFESISSLMSMSKHTTIGLHLMRLAVNRCDTNSPVH